MKTKKIIYALIIAALVVSCKKEPVMHQTLDLGNVDLSGVILSDFSEKIARSTYDELASKTDDLHESCNALSIAPDEAVLETCRQNWKNARSVWEGTEAFLFGPVATENIDPRIDTWPVNFVDLEGLLGNNIPFTEDYIDGLQDALKGFHPIEYLLFGENGNKVSADFTQREFEFLTALTLNLKVLTSSLAAAWHPDTEGSYYTEVIQAGNGSAIYATELAAYEDIVNAMIGICDEVAHGKIEEPLLTQDPSLEESPFSDNSLVDFRNNIRGVLMVYQANFDSDGYGLEDIVREHNLSLDGSIKLKIEQAIAALDGITVPFGEAIISQPVQVQNAIDRIDELAELLDAELLPFLQQYIP